MQYRLSCRLSDRLYVISFHHSRYYGNTHPTICDARRTPVSLVETGICRVPEGALCYPFPLQTMAFFRCQYPEMRGLDLVSISVHQGEVSYKICCRLHIAHRPRTCFSLRLCGCLIGCIIHTVCEISSSPPL